MLNDEIFERLEALIAYCDAHQDGEADWPMVRQLLGCVRGAMGYGPELGLLYAHVRPYIEERLRLLQLEDLWEEFKQRHALPGSAPPTPEVGP